MCAPVFATAEERVVRVVLVGAGMLPIPPVDYGAVEKHIWNLAQALEKQGHSVRIVNKVFGPHSKDEYRFAFWARHEVAREPWDIVHVHTPGVATIFSAMGPRRFVYTTHSRHWAGASGLGENVGHFLETRAVARAVETIAVSRFVADQIERPTHVVPNGVDITKYAPLWDARTGRRAVGVGEVAPHKQWHVAAEAAQRAGAELRIAGPVRDVAYAKRVESAGATLLGALGEDELTRLLGESDVMIHPSVSESFGMAVVEGMSAGLPVICSDLLSFLVQHGEEGFLIPTNGSDEQRIEAASSFLARLLADAPLRRRMADAARAKAAAGYSWDSVAARVVTVYEKAMAKAGARP
jgi:glycosyltransferase involved in cell wall biosynthesis